MSLIFELFLKNYIQSKNTFFFRITKTLDLIVCLIDYIAKGLILNFSLTPAINKKTNINNVLNA